MARLSPIRLPLTIALVLVCALGRAEAQGPPPPSPDQLAKLVAPIALYPDPLVAQVLPASTQPLEIFEAADAVAGGKRPPDDVASKWDPAVQALLSYPTVLKMMRDKIEWTTQLGQAFAGDQGGVLAAIQTVRAQAAKAGNLKTTSQQKVETKNNTIVIEPASPDVIYVPQYDPVAILAPAPYYAYSPLMTFGVGFAAGAATAYACNWGGYGSSSVVVNNNYHYNYNNSYPPYSHYSNSAGSYATYHPQTGTYSGYNAHTDTYGAYNPKTGNYGAYNPSTGNYDVNGNKGTYDGGNKETTSSGSSYKGYGSTSSSSAYKGYGSTESRGSGASSSWGDHSSWGSGSGSGGDAFHGMGGGGWGSREASDRGSDSFGGSGGGDRWGGGGGGGDRWGGGGGGGFGGMRGGGFGGRRR